MGKNGTPDAVIYSSFDSYKDCQIYRHNIGIGSPVTLCIDLKRASLTHLCDAVIGPSGLYKDCPYYNKSCEI